MCRNMAKPLQGLILYHPYVGSYHLTYSIQMWRDNLGLGSNEIDPYGFSVSPFRYAFSRCLTYYDTTKFSRISFHGDVKFSTEVKCLFHTPDITILPWLHAVTSIVRVVQKNQHLCVTECRVYLTEIMFITACSHLCGSVADWLGRWTCDQ